MRSFSKIFIVLSLAAFVGLGVTTAGAALIQNTGMTLVQSGGALTSIDFGDARGVIPVANLIGTHMVATTAGGPGYVPEITTATNRRVAYASTPSQAQALSVMGDGDLNTLTQVGEAGVSCTLDLFFNTPIHTGSYSDLFISQSWVNLIGATISGIDMAGNLVDPSPAAGAPQNLGSGTAAGTLYVVDVDGVATGTTYGAGWSIPYESYGVNFTAGQTLKGVCLAWNDATGFMQYIGEVRGVDTVVPEPTAFTLLASALLGLLAYAWRKRK